MPTLAPMLLWPILAVADTPDAAAVMAEAWLTVESPAELEELERTVGLTVSEGRRTKRGQHQYRVLVSGRARSQLAERGVALEVTREDHRLGSPSGAYRTPSQGQDLLEALAKTSTRADTAIIGTSSDGHPIVGLWIGAEPALGAATLRVLGAHHGDEWSSFELTLALAEALVDADGEDEDLTGLLDTHTVWLVPYVNPDGVLAGSRYSATDVDLNRNYDLQWSDRTYRSGPAPFSEPETRAVRTHALWSLPHASLSMHSGAVNIGYVWNYTTEEVPELDEVEALAWSYAEDCSAEGFYVTNGADWYITYGDTNDWSYGRYGGFDYTVELTDIKAPDEQDIPAYVAAHLPPTLSFLHAARASVELVVLDPDGHPVAAAVERDDLVVGATLPHTGRWAHADLPEDTELRFSAPGFTSMTASPDATTVTLKPTSLWSAPPSPRRISGPTTLSLPPEVADGTLELWRPGGTPLTVEVVDGKAEVDPEGMAPGLWSLWHEDGSGLPHGLAVDTEAVLRFTAASLEAGVLTLQGVGFKEGTRAFATVGAARALREVEVEDSGTSLSLDLSWATQVEPMDLVVVSNGSEEVVLDVTGSPIIDTGIASDTAVDTGPARSEPPCGCRAGGLGPVGLLWMWPLLRRRRE